MKRSSYLQYAAITPLSVKPLRVWGYDKEGRFVCRVEVNGAGIAVYAGKKGRKRLADVSWERLVERLTKPGKES